MNPHKVIWQEGMLLRPQHFQHHDRYYAHQMNSRTQLLGRYMWGFLDLVIDPQPLNSGKVVISRASGVLPDGTLFDLSGDPNAVALDIPPNTGNEWVYLALPLVTANHIESRDAQHADVLARYSTYQVAVADSNAGSDAISDINCARLAFKLLLGEQDSHHGYVKLKIGKVLESTPDGMIRLDALFHPTYLQTDKSGHLTGCLKEVIGMLGHRGDAIAARISSSGKMGGAEVGDFMMLQLINRTELQLKHYLGVEHVHPEELYRTLLTMLGDLSTFSSESKRPRLHSRYEHSDQGLCFRQLMEAIRQVLSMVLEQHAIEIQLHTRDFGIYVSSLHDPSLLKSASFVLAVSANMDAQALRSELPDLLKIAPVEQIRNHINLHLPGVEVEALPVAPRQIPFHTHKTYFVLKLTPEHRELFRRSGGFAFHVPSEIAGCELQFWALRNLPA